MTVTPTTFAAVVINEVLPKTEDSSHQWVELYNNGSTPVSLDRWRIELSSGDVRTFTFNASSVIQPQDFLILYGSQTGLLFGKNGDTIRLLDEKNTLQDSQSYQGILGYYVTVGRAGDGNELWVICTTATPNKTNNCPVPTPTPIPPTPLPTETPLPTVQPSVTLFIVPTLIPTETSTPIPTSSIASPAADGIFVSSNMLLAYLCVFVALAGIILFVVFYHRRMKHTKP